MAEHEIRVDNECDEAEDLKRRLDRALEILDTARCTTNQSALFDIIVQAAYELTQ